MGRRVGLSAVRRHHGARDHHVAARIPGSPRGVRRPVSDEWSSRGERRPRRAGRGALGARLAAQDVSGGRPAAQSAGGRPRPRPLGPSCQRFVRLWVGAGSAAPGVPLHRQAAGTVREQEPLHGPRLDGGEIRGRVRAGRRAVPRARQRARPPSRRARAGGIRARRRASRRVPDGARPVVLLGEVGRAGGRRVAHAGMRGAVELYGRAGERTYYDAALAYAAQEPVTPWMGQDTARHYQWYPWHNNGHYEVWRVGGGPDSARRLMAQYYGRGLEAVVRRAHNGFRIGIPFIWCSNNLLASFATQAQFYRRMTGDSSYLEYEAAALDWLFGTNPRGVSMVIGLGTN